MEAKHTPGFTPGPWKVILHGDEEYPFPLSIHTEDDACWIARDGTVARLSDARLMASAPGLLLALQMALPALEWCDKQFANSPQRGDGINALLFARAAIARAKGEE